jgi:hypothetical protein
VTLPCPGVGFGAATTDVTLLRMITATTG